MSIGIPIKLLHEAEGHIITCETNLGDVYRGKLVEAEDNMNCAMAEVTITFRDGKIKKVANIYIRGSKIRFLILPDMLKNAPMFKGKSANKPGVAGRGKSGILRAQAARGRGQQGGRGGPGGRGGRGAWGPGGGGRGRM